MAEARAERAEAQLASLKQKTLVIVNKCKELEKEKKKWKMMYEAAGGSSAGPKSNAPVSAADMKRNPSRNAKKDKILLDDGSEVTTEEVEKLRAEVCDLRSEQSLSQYKFDFLVNVLRKVEVSAYMSKDVLENEEDSAMALTLISQFVESVHEEVELLVDKVEGNDGEERQVRIASLKKDISKLERKREADKKQRRILKDSNKATKKLAAKAMKRAAQLEADLHQAKMQIMELKMRPVAEPEPEEEPEPEKKMPEVILSPRSKAAETKAKEEGSGVGAFLGKKVEGGAGQQLVQMKAKGIARKKKAAGKFDEVTDASGKATKTGAGLTVINTMRTIQSRVSHDMNVLKITIAEARNLSPGKKKSKGEPVQMWLVVVLGGSEYSTKRKMVEPGKPVTWNEDFAYVISSGLQSRPHIPVQVWWLDPNMKHKKVKKGQEEPSKDKMLGVLQIPIMAFLPLIGSDEQLQKWFPVQKEETQEVCGIVQVALRVESNTSVSQRLLPKEDSFKISELASNISAVDERQSRWKEFDPDVIVAGQEDDGPLDELQFEANKRDPDLLYIVKKIEAGFDLKLGWRNTRKQSWLHLLAKQGNVPVLKKVMGALGKAPKQMEQGDQAGITPILYAAISGNVEALKVLKANGANLGRCDWNNNSALHLAAMNNHLEMCKLLMDQYQLDPNQQDENGATPLHMAAIRGNTSCCEALIAGGALVNAEDREGTSPLLAALIHDHRETSNLLKEKGADGTAFNSRGDTCLWASIVNDNQEFTKYLLKSTGMDLSRTFGANDMTLLMRCLLQLDHVICDSIVGQILAEKPDVNVKNKLGQTALFFAVALDRPNMVTFLVMYCGALVNEKDSAGNTPLHFVQNKDTAKLLLDKGANPNVTNIQGNTPLHTAFAFANGDVVDVLLAAGGDILIKNKNGLTPTDCLLVKNKYVALPFYPEDSKYEPGCGIFIGKEAASHM